MLVFVLVFVLVLVLLFVFVDSVDIVCAAAVTATTDRNAATTIFFILFAPGQSV
jgi:hypothetical protein